MEEQSTEWLLEVLSTAVIIKLRRIIAPLGQLLKEHLINCKQLEIHLQNNHFNTRNFRHDKRVSHR